MPGNEPRSLLKRRCLALLVAVVFAAPGTTPAWQTAGSGARTARAQEKSVKPGINEQWKSTDIKPLIDRLETESREIYNERENLAALVGPRPGAAIGDVGAGSGFMVELFSRLVGPAGKVYAVDINAKLLEHIARRAKEQGLRNIETVLTREDSLDLPANSVDLVFVCDTYHHFEYPKSSLLGIYQALRPGGQLVLVDFRRALGVSSEWTLEHVRAGQEVFTKEITEAGFQLTNVHNVSFLKENYVLRFRKVEQR